MSSYVIDNGSGRGCLRSATRWDKEGLESTNNVGCNKFVEYVVAASLQVGNGFFEGKDGGAGCEVVTKAGDGRVVSSQNILDV